MSRVWNFFSKSYLKSHVHTLDPRLKYQRWGFLIFFVFAYNQIWITSFLFYFVFLKSKLSHQRLLTSAYSLSVLPCIFIRIKNVIHCSLFLCITPISPNTYYMRLFNSCFLRRSSTYMPSDVYNLLIPWCSFESCMTIYILLT